jgi:hypothetical protein
MSNDKNEKLSMPNLSLNVSMPDGQNELVKPEQLTGLYTEILEDIRDDRKEIDEVLKNFLDMILNEGDSTTSSKEAAVNLLKIKTETSDKKAKIMDLLMRAFLKERDTFPRYLAAHQHNEIKIEDNSKKRQLLKSIQKEVENAK